MNINGEANAENSTALIVAARDGDIDTVNELLQLEFPAIDINMQDDDGNTALMYALNQGYEEIWKLLIRNGADPHELKDQIRYRSKFKSNLREAQAYKQEFDLITMTRNKHRCHTIKEELMTFVWNPERPFTQWALLDEFSEELKSSIVGGAGIY